MSKRIFYHLNDLDCNSSWFSQFNMIYYKKPELDEHAASVPEGDYVADLDALMYWLSIDARGELAFKEDAFSQR